MHASSRSALKVESPIHIGIIEPQRLFAPFLVQILSDAGFVVVAMLDSMHLGEIERHEPRVVFVDIDFIEMEPISALRQLRVAVPNATICSYTGRIDPDWAAACTRAGANCVISKSATPSEIIHGIGRAIRVGSFLDHRFDDELVPEDSPN